MVIQFNHTNRGVCSDVIGERWGHSTTCRHSAWRYVSILTYPLPPTRLHVHVSRHPVDVSNQTRMYHSRTVESYNPYE